MEMLKSSSFESASGCMLPASEWWWWCGRHIHIKSWTSGKRCPPTLTVCESSEHQCYIHTAHLSSSGCRSPHHWLSSSTHSLMELHLDTCRVSWLCHWVLYFGSWKRPERLLSARPLLPWTLWSIKDQMVSAEHPSSHDAFIALAIKIDNRLREQEKWRRAVVPPNQRGHSTMQPSPCFLLIGLLRMSHALSDEWQPMWRLVHLLWWVGTFYGFLSSVSFPHPLTDIEVITSSQSHWGSGGLWSRWEVLLHSMQSTDEPLCHDLKAQMNPCPARISSAPVSDLRVSSHHWYF